MKHLTHMCIYLCHSFSLTDWNQAQKEVQTGWILLSQSAEPVSCTAVLLLQGLHHTHPGLSSCVSWLLAKHLAQVSTCRLSLTWWGWIGDNVECNEEQSLAIKHKLMHHQPSLVLLQPLAKRMSTYRRCHLGSLLSVLIRALQTISGSFNCSSSQGATEETKTLDRLVLQNSCSQSQTSARAFSLSDRMSLTTVSLFIRRAARMSRVHSWREKIIKIMHIEIEKKISILNILNA